MTNSVVVLSAVRSAIGSFGGSLSGLEPAELARQVLSAAIERSSVDASSYQYVTMGNVLPTETRYAYVARVASVKAGLSMDSVAMSVNRLCGSGLQAIISSAQQIELGQCDFAIGGGVEVMSRAGYMSPAMRSGARMGHSQMIDMMMAALTDPFDDMHMGITAENLAEKWNISREEQDAFAAESHRRAAAAVEAGHFDSQIVPVTLKTRKGEVVFDKDEHIKASTTAESLSGLRPAFKKDGTVTAGNASGLNDGAAFVSLANEAVAKEHGLQPIARLVGYAVRGVESHIMGEGPIPACRALLANTGLTIEQIDVIESNEAFAAQALTVSKQLGFDPAKANPNGGAIALGHPVGATGGYITAKAIHELHRVQGRYALVTMCIGGGQGIAAIFERV